MATLWTCFVARANHVQLSAALPAAMFLAVWIVYAADRLLDARLLDARLLDARLLDVRTTPATILQPRHRFHRAHRAAFIAAILLAAAALAVLLRSFPPGLLHPYLILAALLAAWFALIHLTPRLTPRSLPKELIPGLFFAAAVFIPAHDFFSTALLFAVLCMLNCLYIHAWEHPASAPAQLAGAHPTTRAAIPILPQLTLATILTSLLFAAIRARDALPTLLAIALAAAALLVLNQRRRRFTPITLRAAADIVLLTPVLLWPLLR